jgi:hypothetical protein
VELDEVASGGGGTVLHANIVIGAGGKEINFIQTDVVAVVAFTLKQAVEEPAAFGFPRMVREIGL